MKMSSGGAAEGGRTGPGDVSFTHRHLKTHITALSAKGDILFIGEGQHCHAYDVISGRQVASTQVFRAAVVHGLRVHQPGPVDDSGTWQVLVFGQKSVAVLLYLTTEGRFSVLLGERSIEDWIVDAGLEKDLSHIVIATGHNSLLRCQVPNLVECYCRELGEHTSSSSTSSRPVAKTALHSMPEASPETQELRSVECGSRLKERTFGGNSNKPASKNPVCIIPDASLATEEPGQTSSLVPKPPHCPVSETSSVTVEPKSIDLVDRVKKDVRSGALAVVARVTCVEKCVLFSGHLVMMSGCWEGAVMLAGTMALQVMVWGPWGPRDDDGSALPLHCLWGHQGSIFSITFSPSQGLITTTSDDRSLRVWEVVKQDTHTPSTVLTTTLPATPEEERLYWTSAKITEKFVLYGHRARVWRSLILPSFLVSVGEDSLVCVWEHSGALVASWRAHEGASIWSVAASEGAKARLITGGADGSVKAWSLSAVVPVKAEPVSGLPHSDSLGHECVVLAGRCSDVATGQGDAIPSLNSEEEDSSMPEESHELFSVPHQEASRTATSKDAATDFSGLISQMEEINLFESHDRSNTPQKQPASNSKSSVTTDFPRCLALIGDSLLAVVTNNGKVYSSSHEGPWCLEHEDKRLRNYSILEASPDRRRVAVGTLTGAIVVLCLAEGRRLVVEGEAEGAPGKLFALQWLTDSHVLALGAAGLMTTWKIETEGTVRSVSTHHLPVSMHRWLCAVYVPSSADTLAPTTTTADTTTPYLICGDRAGSLHLYTQTDPKPQDTLRGIHGKNGVTSLLSWGVRGIVYSSGRDGCVRSLQVVCGGGEAACHPRLQPLTVTRVCGASWVARLLCVGGKLLAVCFHGVKLRLWDVDAEQALLEVECGGAHRSWDLMVCGGDDEQQGKMVVCGVGEQQGKMVCGGDEQQGKMVVCGGDKKGSQVCGEEYSLSCGFLKDGLTYTFSTSLADKLLPVIKPPLNSQETMGVCVLHQQGSETLLVTAGEDTTLRLHTLRHPGTSRPLAVLRSHLSGVRTLCLVEGLSGTLSNSAKEWRGQVADGTKDSGIQSNSALEDNSGRKVTGKDNGTVWMVSAGGRAEFKLWQCCVNNIASTNKHPTRGSFPSNTSTHPPGNMSGVEADQELSVTCREVGSHMLRTGSHKTWRNQQLTFDPETRYMAAAAHWITSSLAMVALASSDGFLRIFSFQPGGEKLGGVTEVEGMRLEEVCAVDCGCCLLGVARLGMLVTRTIIVTYSTKGHIAFWDLQAVEEWLIEHTSHSGHTHSPPQPRQVTTVAAHQSGVNSIAFHHHHPPDDPAHITMATGGDDNKISVWEVVVEEKLDGVEVTVTHRCSVFGHASQVSGLAWLSGDHLVSASIDQRLIVWKYNRGEATQKKATQDRNFNIETRELNKAAAWQENRTLHKEITDNRVTHIETNEVSKRMRHEDRTTLKEPSEPSQVTRPDDNIAKYQALLVPVGSCFTGVPDVKGIVVADVDDGRKTGENYSQVIEKRVFVYGMGLQVFDVAVDGSVR